MGQQEIVQGGGDNYKTSGVGGDDSNSSSSSDKKLTLWRRAKFCAEAVTAAACLLWLIYWFLSPDPRSDDKYLELNDRVYNRFFRTDGREGTVLFFQTLPWVVVVVFSFLIIELRQRIKEREVTHGGPSTYTRRWSLGTYPVWVSRWSPFGPILRASELLGILGIVILITYNFGRSSYHSFSRIDDGTITHHHHSNAPIPPNSWQKVNYASFYFGTISIVPFSLLWVPVSRGSPLLRIIGIPFEQAIRYHIWLSNLMVALITLHSVGYIVFYANTSQSSLIYGWVTTQEQCSVVAGLVAWILGILIWFTSLSFFRRRFYDSFFTLHHMYLLFSLFWLYHAVWNYHFFIIPILLFFVDRFLRMIQSRHTVQVLSARHLESGAIELTFPFDAKSTDDKGIKGNSVYNALSTWCIQIPSVSDREWHFFSATSSPIDEKQTLSIIIKPLGGWTNALSNKFNNEKQSSMGSSCPFSFKAKVEGPYGDESNFYLKYKTLILIAGGIGITPLLAILRDILLRYKDNTNRSKCLPTSVVVYHCIRQPEELCLINSVNPNTILPGYEELGLSIKVHVYITSKVMQDYNSIQGQVSTSIEMKEQVLNLSKFIISHPKSQNLLFLPPYSNKGESYQSDTISQISSTGKTKWVACTTIASIIGYFVVSGLANTLIIKSYDGHTFPNYNRAHLVVVSLILGVLVFGGLVVLAWYESLQRTKKNVATVQPRSQSATPSPAKSYKGFVDDETYVGLEVGASPWVGDVHLFHRPNWKAIFEDFSQQYQSECVGVLVSGSESMQEDVARECKRNSSFTLSAHKSDSGNMNVIYHYHSVSFKL